jgi:RimJ/RimL family protein N-acetyltransferase
MTVGTLERVQTARMICERLRPEHAPELCELLLDPRVARTLWPTVEPPTAQDVTDSLSARIEHWDRYGFGLWFVRDRATGQMVGRGGLQHTYASGPDEVEAGWAIVPERWGEGLATELAVTCVEVAFGALGLSEIVALAQPGNLASRRVMEKAGFEIEREIIYAQLPHLLHRRRRGDGDY